VHNNKFIAAVCVCNVHVCVRVCAYSFKKPCSPHFPLYLHGVSVCVGIVNAASVLGAVFAYICGGILLELYTHFDTINTSTSVPCTSRRFINQQRRHIEVEKIDIATVKSVKNLGNTVEHCLALFGGPML